MFASCAVVNAFLAGGFGCGFGAGEVPIAAEGWGRCPTLKSPLVGAGRRLAAITPRPIEAMGLALLVLRMMFSVEPGSCPKVAAQDMARTLVARLCRVVRAAKG